MRVEFVGLGDQGEPMAQRILQGRFDLTVFARRPSQAAELIKSGANEAASVAEVAQQCDLFAVCVGTDDQLEAVCAEALPNLRQGAIVVLHSTVHPETYAKIGRAAAQYGVHGLDAPVSGGRKRALMACPPSW